MASNVCWACSAELSGPQLLCPACGKVQPVTGAAAAPDYFQAFGLERRFQLDAAELERSFYRLSRKLHPDRFARASAEEQDWSLAAASLLNDAYRALKDPIRRTEYLLQLEGAEIGEEFSGKGRGENRKPPVDLLEEAFELNMELEEARMAQKMGDDDPMLIANLESSRTKFEGLLAESDAALESESGKWDAGDAAARKSAQDAMVALLDRRNYLRNLVRDVNEVLAVGSGTNS